MKIITIIVILTITLTYEKNGDFRMVDCRIKIDIIQFELRQRFECGLMTFWLMPLKWDIKEHYLGENTVEIWYEVLTLFGWGNHEKRVYCRLSVLNQRRFMWLTDLTAHVSLFITELSTQDLICTAGWHRLVWSYEAI